MQIPAAGKADAGWIWQALEADIADRLKLLDTLEGASLQREAQRICRRIKARTATPPGLLLMLDGLDEVSEADGRRKRLLGAVQRLVDGLPDHNRLLVTARPYAYADPKLRLKGVPYSVLAPFDEDQLARFMRNWHRVERGVKGLSEAEAEARARADDLIGRLQSRPEVRRLAERPLHASLIASLNLRGNRLPEDRCQLYEEIIELLLVRWRSGESAFRDRNGRVMDLPEQELHHCLEALAYQAHEAQRGSRDSRDAADISKAMVEQAFEPLLDHYGRLDLLDYLRRHAGILIGKEEDRFAFPHRAFQEYLAMRRLDARTDDSLVRTVLADPLWWREVFRLAVASQRRTPRNGIHLVRDLLDAGEKLPVGQRRPIAVLSGLALLELELTPRERDEPAHRRVREQLAALIGDHDALDPPERLEAGLVLGRLGDHRPGVGLDAGGLPAVVWVDIPAGEFIYQQGERRALPAFRIGRYPVTSEQFRAFLEAGDGHGNREWWAGFESEYREPEKPSWNEGNCPRERVEWYQAVAFCRWLSARSSCEIRLPTEEEWERAARCTDGREYPWGDGYHGGFVNINEVDAGPHYLERISPVGSYPQGRSEEGVDDLAGNVDEWCLNKYDKPEVIEVDTSGDRRVVRGGSWIDLLEFARSAFRRRLQPNYRDFDLGFRVLCAAPIRSED